MKPSTIHKLSASTATLVLILFALILFISLVVYPNELKLQSLITSCSVTNNTNSNFVEKLSVKPDLRIFIGILTVADYYERRHLLRLLYSLQTNLTAHVDIRFVFCRLDKEEQQVLVALEILKYNDIIILDCKESINDGKTYAYFSTMPKLYNGENGNIPYDYVFKADDDIYFRLPYLIESLKPLPREDMYYGFLLPCDVVDYSKLFMYGMGYALSWDLVEWISTSEMVKNISFIHERGEDDLVAQWLREGNKGNNRFSTRTTGQMYDYPIPNPLNNCSHDFVPDTISVHRLKNNLRWARTLKYMNVTAGLEPKTKFYDLDCGECWT